MALSDKSHIGLLLTKVAPSHIGLLLKIALRKVLAATDLLTCPISERVCRRGPHPDSSGAREDEIVWFCQSFQLRFLFGVSESYIFVSFNKCKMSGSYNMFGSVFNSLTNVAPSHIGLLLTKVAPSNIGLLLKIALFKVLAATDLLTCPISERVCRGGPHPDSSGAREDEIVWSVYGEKIR